jgi:hypothetical protein
MDSMKNEPIQATNRFIKEQQETLPGDGSTFTLWKFSDQLTKVYDDTDLRKVKPLDDYVPGGMTALYDAIGRAISTKMAKVKHENVVCVILTDGEENASKEYKQDQIRKMIKDAETDHAWKFLYLGANQDAFQNGGNLGVAHTACTSFSATPDGFSQAVQQTSAGIRSMRLNACSPQVQQPVPVKSAPTSSNQGSMFSSFRNFVGSSMQ